MLSFGYPHRFKAAAKRLGVSKGVKQNHSVYLLGVITLDLSG
tara:strand:- start:2659 stop:2784 length:126 start_codon:yes stop_codon:yes gene_type:complete